MWYNAARVLGEYVPMARSDGPSPVPGAPVEGAGPLYEHAFALEYQGRGMDAVQLYVRAAQSGNGKAALRLGEIFSLGIPGVARDYAQSLKWYNAARILGEEVPMARSGSSPPGR